MTGLSRRRFLQGSAALAGGAILGGGPFQSYIAHAARGGKTGPGPHPDYGPLVAVPDLRDNVARLALPEGFTYRSFHMAGTPLAPGGTMPTPARSDGMAAFAAGRGMYAVVRNHEVNGPVGAFGDPALAYDPATGGGTTTFLVRKDGEVVDGWVSLNGTQMNCAGGRTPWGSWLTCEETVNGPDVGNDFTNGNNALLTQKHGYMFEVPTEGVSDGVPIRSAGRFAHEAAAVDPVSGFVYLTEDNFAFPSGFYRYVPPNDPFTDGKVADGGELQMLRVQDQHGIDLSLAQGQGATFAVDWVTIDDPDPTFAPGTTNNQAIVAVSNQGLAQGAAKFSRLEGAYFDAGTVYFVSTQGGGAPNDPTQPVSGGAFGTGRGQVWAYDIAASQLRLVYESPSAATLDLPDNVVTTRSGALLLCEDNTAPNFLRGLTPDGDLFDFARNTIPGQTGDEFAGATFGPDFHTLFVNIQSGASLTFAIWGPWRRGPFG
jgi:secreted PhoX family phosphatase